VAEVFEEMAERSIPGYRELLTGIGEIGRMVIRPGSLAYDLGCALGAAAMAIAEAAPDGVTIVAVDNSLPMLLRLKERLERSPYRSRILPICADIRDIRFSRASLVVLNFTLQFLPPDERLPLLRRIAGAVMPGGALLLSEKIAPTEPEERLRLTYLHSRFKESRGYRRREIYHKRQALERVLISDSLETHYHRLQLAGWTQIDLWFQRLNFISILARK